MPRMTLRSSLPAKLAMIFAVCAYVWTLALALIPPSKLNLPVPVAFLLCPACIFTVTVDPSFSTVALLLAPLNAVIYAFLGLCLGSLFRPSQL
jgi:hypothetical protein